VTTFYFFFFPLLVRIAKKALTMADGAGPISVAVNVVILIACVVFISTLFQDFYFHALAFVNAPADIRHHLFTVDSCIQENESYLIDIGQLNRFEEGRGALDKKRLTDLITETRKVSEDLKNDMYTLGARRGSEREKLDFWARLDWVVRRRILEKKLERLDALRLRLLVMHLSIMAS
jgi:hypothetical protein